MHPDTSLSDGFEMAGWEHPDVDENASSTPTKPQQKFSCSRACAESCEQVGNIELRFCYGASVIKVVRTADTVDADHGKPMQWTVEMPMENIVSVVTGRTEDTPAG